MKTTVDKNTNGKVVITAEIDVQTIGEAKNHALSHMGEHITAPGFRAGKAPAHVVEKQVRVDKLAEETLSHAAESAYVAALEEHKLAPITRPSVSIPKVKDAKSNEEATDLLWPSMTEEGITIELHTFIMPEITLGKWEDIVKKAKVKEEKKSDKEQGTGDKGKKKKRTKEQPSRHSELDSESDQEIPDHDSHAASRGVQDDKAPELTDEQKDRQLEDAIVEALVDKVNFDVADELIDGETDQMLYRQVETVQKLGISYEDYLKTQNKTWEDVRTQTRPEAEKVVRARFLISEVAKELEDIVGEEPKVQDVLAHLIAINKGESKPKKTTKKTEKKDSKSKKKSEKKPAKKK